MIQNKQNCSSTTLVRTPVASGGPPGCYCTSSSAVLAAENKSAWLSGSISDCAFVFVRNERTSKRTVHSAYSTLLVYYERAAVQRATFPLVISTTRGLLSAKI